MKIKQIQNVKFLIQNKDNEYVVGLFAGRRTDGTDIIERVIVDEREFQELEKIYNRQTMAGEREIQASKGVLGYTSGQQVKARKGFSWSEA